MHGWVFCNLQPSIADQDPNYLVGSITISWFIHKLGSKQYENHKLCLRICTVYKQLWIILSLLKCVRSI